MYDFRDSPASSKLLPMHAAMYKHVHTHTHTHTLQILLLKLKIPLNIFFPTIVLRYK